MLFLLLLQALGLTSGSFNKPYMGPRGKPTPGPEAATVYVPGTPGGAWTPEEVDSTRARVLQMIHPSWDVKRLMYFKLDVSGKGRSITETNLERLVFHDCIPYADGTGGCDGCLNWEGMGATPPAVNDFAPTGMKKNLYDITPINATDNNGLGNAVYALELIYKTIDWPFQDATLETSLHQSGKSRADLWQLAGLVALERSLERANRACDLDFNARQQVTLLESREACEIKITKPLKFLTGRSDCMSDDPEGRGYVTHKAEAQPRLFGDARHILDYGRDFFKMDAEHWTALQAIHGAAHAAQIGVKYTWFGPKYISNMYFKWIANKPRYKFDIGGGLDFGGGPLFTSVGDVDGKPVAHTGWRTSCMYAWNTTEGGPCFLRPTTYSNPETPNADKVIWPKCAKCVPGSDGVRSRTCEISKYCKEATCDNNGVLKDGIHKGLDKKVKGPWSENDKAGRHGGWNNQFALPYEVGLFWNFTTSESEGQRAIGCPGLDEPMGVVNTDSPDYKPNWPYRNNNSPIWNSPAMQCDKNMYAPDGRPMWEVVDALASDNELFAEKFLESWQMMTSNGYQATDLVDGPHNGWVGHYSLAKQGKIANGDDFEKYIEENAPVWFTDEKVDPFICGHGGHADTSCGLRFSTCFDKFFEEGDCTGKGEEDKSYDF